MINFYHISLQYLVGPNTSCSRNVLLFQRENIKPLIHLTDLFGSLNILVYSVVPTSKKSDSET